MSSIPRRPPPAAIIALAGELDPGKIISLQRRIGQSLEAGLPGVVIDLGAVTGAGPETLSMLCGVLRRINRRNATLVLAGGSPQLRHVIERSEIDGVDLHPPVEAVVSRPAAPAPVLAQ